MKLIVGLGNPGLRYKNTRHNVGYRIVESLAKERGIRVKRKLFKGLSGEGRIAGGPVMFLLPQTYMNLSGESVTSAMGKIKDISNVLVVYDDKDLSLGNIRFRAKGSSGGHNGLKSVIEELGSLDIQRLRIGIKPEKEIYDLSDFVLKPFAKDERAILTETIERAITGIKKWVSDGINLCMTTYNRKDKI